MKQTLQLRLGQQLTMTPQLQQAIRLLQLSTLELRTEIQQALESNVMLETADEAETAWDDGESPSDGETEWNQETDADAGDGDGELPGSGADSGNLGEDLAIDASWDDIYDGSTAYSAPGLDDQRDSLENQTAGGQTLQDYLLWQIQLAGLPPRTLAVAEVLVDAIRDDGYLGSPPEDILATLPPEWQIGAEEMEAALAAVQQLDPVGVGARDPREALLIQLDQLPPDTPWLTEARTLVDRHLELLADRHYSQLKRRMRLDLEELQQVLTLIRTLDPHPGWRFSSERTEYVVPDVFVRRVGDDWQVELNPDAFPRLRVNSYYASLVRRADDGRDNTLMRNHLQEARWLIKSLRSRNDTLLKVANCIVERQRGFFDHGEEAMQPLVLREVAETIDMHESTISRITNQKYMHTPRGTLQFKYFFSSHVQTVDGGECSATAIRARIRRLIAAEPPAQPLSDSRLAELLQADGINVARRTVAKYRENMAIASSTARKRLT